MLDKITVADLLHNEINPITQLQKFINIQYHIMFMLSTDTLEHL